MRASELLASRVVDGTGRPAGSVRDLRLVRLGDGRLRVVGLVVGDGFLAWPAHAWGFAEGRASGPWLLRKLAARAVRRARYVPAGDVVDWGPGTVRIRSHGSELRHLGSAAVRAYAAARSSGAGIGGGRP